MSSSRYWNENSPEEAGVLHLVNLRIFRESVSETIQALEKNPRGAPYEELIVRLEICYACLERDRELLLPGELQSLKDKIQSYKDGRSS